MNQAAINACVWRAYAKAAAVLGVSGEQYRPVDALAPMAQQHAQPILSFDVSPGFSFSKPLTWGTATAYVLTDLGSDTAVGDILVCQGRTYFVVSAEPMRPPACILCNHTVTVSGVTGTQGDVVEGCPASILMKAKGESSGSGVPGASRPGQFMLYLPLLPGVVLSPYMTVTTDLGTTYTLNAVEHSGFGVRCTMSMQQV